jgi:microtubule-associated protein-like 6
VEGVTIGGGGGPLKDGVALKGPWIKTAAEVAWQPMPAVRPEAPGGALLEWVHGYSSAVMRNNLRYTAQHHVVYPAAGVGVVLCKEPHAQRFYLNHTDDITALALHEERGRSIVATGQVGAHCPRVCLWDADTTDTLCTIDDFHTGAILHVAFSPDGRNLATVGQDPDHMVAVYALEYFEDGHIGVQSRIFAGKSAPFKVLACAFMDNNRFVTCGERHIFFWKRENREARFTKEKGIFGRANDLETLLCVQVRGQTD